MNKISKQWKQFILGAVLLSAGMTAFLLVNPGVANAWDTTTTTTTCSSTTSTTEVPTSTVVVSPNKVQVSEPSNPEPALPPSTEVPPIVPVTRPALAFTP